MISLPKLLQATLPVLERYARWQHLELPHRLVFDSDERYRQRVAHCVFFELMVSEDDRGPEPYRMEW
jgi:hypothetical protein